MPRFPTVRRLSPIERVWLAADRVCPPFVNQLVLEGEGAFDEAAWRAALGHTSAGSRVVLRGWLGTCRWVDSGRPPPVRVVDGSAWDGHRPEGAPFLRDPLPPGSGPTCEVLLVRGDVPRVVFRTHHAVMDGRGTLTFVDEVFRALRGEAPPPVDLATTDLDLAKRLPGGRPEPPLRDCPAPTGAPAGGSKDVTWRRRFVPGRWSGLLPRVVHAIGILAARHGGPVRLGVPVDLRRHTELRSTANLTGMVLVDFDPTWAPDDVTRALEAGLAAGRDGVFVRVAEPVRGIPLRLMAWFGRRATDAALARGRFDGSGCVSNLGRLPLETFRGGGFTARTGFFIPPGNAGQPFFISLAGHAQGVELCVTSAAALATDGRLDAALDALAAALSPAGP